MMMRRSEFDEPELPTLLFPPSDQILKFLPSLPCSR